MPARLGLLGGCRRGAKNKSRHAFLFHFSRVGLSVEIRLIGRRFFLAIHEADSLIVEQRQGQCLESAHSAPAKGVRSCRAVDYLQ